MTVLPICIAGEPVLHQPAAPVEAFDETLATLIEDMFDTMRAAPGVGLAAPQVGVNLAVFVYEWEDSEGEVHSGVAVNPRLLISPPSVAELDVDQEVEGCLSFPGERFPLRRSDSAVLYAQDTEGKAYEAQATGWLARIWQHEYDHLLGLLYVDRLDGVYQRTARKVIRKAGWGVEGVTWMPGVDHLEG